MIQIKLKHCLWFFFFLPFLWRQVFENQIVPISSTHLAFSDQDTPPSGITYRITSLLNEEEGSVEHEDFPFKSILKFTQKDVDQGKILYRPPQQEIGTEEMTVSFKFVGMCVFFLEVSLGFGVWMS